METTAPPTDYEYDAYVSARDADFTSRWIDEFLLLFRFWLSEYLGRGVTIFQRTERNAANRANALLASRCLLTISTPSYFQSEICKSEWEAFKMRDQFVTSRQLIIPLVPSGSLEPDRFRAQTWDLTRFSFIGEGFRQTELYVDFQLLTQDIARHTADVIRDAPPFSPVPFVTLGAQS